MDMVFHPGFGRSRSAYTALCSGVLFPVHELLKGHSSVAVRRRLEAQEWWPRDRLEAWRVERLRDFLMAVGARVPHYRALFARLDFDPAGVTSLTDLQRLPLTDKGVVRAAGDRLKAEGARGLSSYSTGGSTGDPLIFSIGKARRSHDVGAKWRATRWWGVDIGDPELLVWGSPIELKAQDRVRQWRDWVLRTKLLSAFEMSAANLDRFVATIRARRPAMLFAYPAALALVASHARARGIALDDLGVRVAFVTSEPLYPAQRAAITEAFGCPVANGYGARDSGFLAHECPHGGMHVQAEDIIVEIVDGAGRVLGPGEAGEIVVTHTATRDFPFLRYRTGDIGVLSDEACPCGRSLPLLREIQGRAIEFLLATDGRVVSGHAMEYTVRQVAGVERYQVVQHRRDLVELRLVVRPPFGAAGAERLVRDCTARLGPDTTIRISLVPEIPNDRNGKYRHVVSHLPAAERTWAQASPQP
ncbi:MAG: capsular polysaccharide biosynthesis protein CapK [Rhodocyclaceae bacterium]|nr:capsular polysaccharide biosynthesis protein CapK [Rhodocyclaceae bacterium]